MKKIAFVTPLPPVRSGIAHYATLLLPRLAERYEMTAVVDQPEVDAPAGCNVISYTDFAPQRASFDRVICQLGNNLYHEVAYRAANEQRSIAVLHDLVLHHLLTEVSLARGDANEYERELRRNHGAAGAALARGRAAGFHVELGNFLYPASVAVAAASQHVIVHTRYAAETLRSFGVTTPITVTGNPVPPIATFGADEIARSRDSLGFGPSDVVIGMFGFVTEAKRPREVFDAFARATARDARLRLLVVGQPEPKIHLDELVAAAGVEGSRWKALGYVAEEAFDRLIAATDRIVNLRYPTAGEMSGPLVRIIASGKEVAVSDFAQFAEVPRGLAVRIPFDREIDALVDFMIGGAREHATAGERRRWLDEHASLEATLQSYVRVIEGSAGDEIDVPVVMAGTIPLFPEVEARLDLSRSGEAVTVVLSLRNRGTTLRAPLYGEPRLYFNVKLFEGTGAIASRWVAVERDVTRGESVTLTARFDHAGRATRAAVFPVIGGIPAFDLDPVAEAEIVG